jgi:hypothetical protein
MVRFHIAVLTALLSVAGVSQAQTGPAGPATNNGPTTPQTNASQLSPDRLTQYLKGQGHPVEKKTFQNGQVALLASIKKDGWNFQVEIGFTLDQTAWGLACPLAAVPTSQAHLTEILKLSHKLAPAHFSARDSDQKLLFEDPDYNTRISEADFQKILDGFLKKVRDSHPIWSGSQSAAIASTPAPTNNTTPAVAQGLANTNWIGTENLESYGRLEFRFLADGKVMMIDTAGQTIGAYSQNGQSLTLTFHTDNVYAVYQGAVNGNVFAGTGRAKDGATWTFSVAK